MRVAFSGMAVLAVVIAWGIPATAHHSQAFYFDTTKAIRLEGEILRVEWVNPHILVDAFAVTWRELKKGYFAAHIFQSCMD